MRLLLSVVSIAALVGGAHASAVRPPRAVVRVDHRHRRRSVAVVPRGGGGFRDRFGDHKHDKGGAAAAPLRRWSTVGPLALAPLRQGLASIPSRMRAAVWRKGQLRPWAQRALYCATSMTTACAVGRNRYIGVCATSMANGGAPQNGFIGKTVVGVSRQLFSFARLRPRLTCVRRGVVSLSWRPRCSLSTVDLRSFVPLARFARARGSQGGWGDAPPS